MKFNTLIPLAALALASCTNESFVGVHDVEPEVVEQPVAVVFEGYGVNTAAGTRATAADYASLLGGKFRLYAEADGAVVFDNYEVRWLDEASGSITAPNQWEYLGYTSKAVSPAIQIPKYWDESASRYDFVAFAGLNDTGADIQRITSISENTFLVSAANMHSLFYANRVSATKEGATAVLGISPEFVPYKTTIKFTFRRATARLRIGFYETIPGYSVRDMKFYYYADDCFDSDNSSDSELADQPLSETTSAVLQGLFPTAGNFTITYDADNSAHAKFLDTDAAAVISHSRQLGSLNYDADGNLGTSSAAVTFALSSETLDGTTATTQWHPLLPYENNPRELHLRADYTLVSLDGSGETINVRGAEATVPAEYCQWQPNYSYTYIFKVNTSTGHTGTATDPAGLYPITFDAEVSDVVVTDETTHEIDSWPTN